MRNLIFYSLAITPEGAQYVEQLRESVRSVCHHNPWATVVVFTLNSQLAGAVKREIIQAGAEIVHLGSYRKLLAHFAPERARFLEHYPTLHKWFGLALGSSRKFDRYLYLDCDTYCFHSLRSLFSRSSNWDVMAREEPKTKGSHLGEDHAYFDPAKMQNLAQSLGCGQVRPFNLGVVLMNAKTTRYFATHQAEFLEHAFRLSVQIARQAIEKQKPFPEQPSSDIAFLIQQMKSPVLSKIKPLAAYPTSNFWIREQVAAWLTLGKAGVRVRLFNQARVMQGREFMQVEQIEDLPNLVHYFSANTRQFFKVFRPAVEILKRPA